MNWIDWVLRRMGQDAPKNTRAVAIPNGKGGFVVKTGMPLIVKGKTT